MKDFLRQLRWIVLVAIGVLLGVFIVQNAAIVELQLFTWTVSSRRAFLVVTCVAIGFVIGWVFGYTTRRR